MCKFSYYKKYLLYFSITNIFFIISKIEYNSSNNSVC